MRTISPVRPDPSASIAATVPAGVGATLGLGGPLWLAGVLGGGALLALAWYRLSRCRLTIGEASISIRQGFAERIIPFSDVAFSSTVESDHPPRVVRLDLYGRATEIPPGRPGAAFRRMARIALFPFPPDDVAWLLDHPGLNVIARLKSRRQG